MKKNSFFAFVFVLLISSISLNGCIFGNRSKDSKMSITSPVFENSDPIPKKYSADGYDISPPLVFDNIPENAKSLALIVEDPDAPVGVWDHWIIFNIPPDVSEIKEGAVPWGTVGRNSWGHTVYGGPAPPSGTHRYYFRLYALDAILDIQEGASRMMLDMAMKGHVVEEAELMGTYTRK